MFGRVAACGVAAVFLVIAVVSSGETNASVDPYMSAATAIATSQPPQAQTPESATAQADDQAAAPHQAPEPGAQQPQAIPQMPANDASPGPAKIAALDPAEPDLAATRLAQPPLHPAATEPFGRDVRAVAGGELLTKWSGVEADIRAESEILARCRADADTCPFPARNFLAIIAQGRARTGRARIGVINRAVNMAIRPMSDLAQWGVVDRWSAPLDTFTTGRGDCEDYAIAKYVALKEAGVADEDLRLVIVRNLAADEDHAVVAARLDGAWIILDNRWLMLLADAEMPQVTPEFVLDQTGVWQFAPAAGPDRRRAFAPDGGGTSVPGSIAAP